MGYRPLIIVCLLATQSLAAFDPLTVGMGARSLGLGGANTATVFDADTVFANPAGLGEIDNIKLTSMAGTLMEDVNYTVLGGVYPLGQQGALGFGYSGAYVSGIELRDNIGNLTSRATFGDSVFLGSFGKKLNESWSIGIGLKYYISKGTEISSGDRNSANLDIGVLQHGLEWLSLGAVIQNPLASDLPRTFKAGAKMEPCDSLDLAYDARFSFDAVRTPTQHFGLEFSPGDQLTVRAGSDAGSLTAGLSFRYAGLGFHYAYHAFNGFDGNYANFFSLSYDEKGWPPENPSDAYLAKLTPRSNY
jgi:hypothetical protein